MPTPRHAHCLPLLTKWKSTVWRRAVACAAAMPAILGLAGALLPAPSQAQTVLEATGPQPRLPTISLAAGSHVIQAEVADTEERRRRGLMYRAPLTGNDGMLFVFEQPDMQCFWMRNTPNPLSIAFIGADGNIVNIEEMAAQSDDTHCSRRAVAYALEMAPGWFTQRGLTAGSRIGGLP